MNDEKIKENRMYYRSVADAFFNKIKSKGTLSDNKVDFYRNELIKWGNYSKRMKDKYHNECCDDGGYSFGTAHYVASRVNFGLQCSLANIQLDKMIKDGRIHPKLLEFEFDI